MFPIKRRRLQSVKEIASDFWDIYRTSTDHSD